MEKKGTKMFTFYLGNEELLMTLGLVYLSWWFFCLQTFLHFLFSICAHVLSVIENEVNVTLE